MTEEATQSGGADQSASRDYRLIEKMRGKPFPLRCMFLTFGISALLCTTSIVVKGSLYIVYSNTRDLNISTKDVHRA
jgi:hypothetical protein